MKHCRKLGFANDYRNDALTQRLIRCYMALPILPSDHIMNTFNAINRTMPPGSKLTILKQYMEPQRINSSSHYLMGISVFGMQRTNNDTEGNNRRLKMLAVKFKFTEII